MQHCFIKGRKEVPECETAFKSFLESSGVVSLKGLASKVVCIWYNINNVRKVPAAILIIINIQRCWLFRRRKCTAAQIVTGSEEASGSRTHTL